MDIASKVIKTELINWRKLQFIQSDNFKDISDSAKQAIKNSLLKNDFAQPFYVWHDSKEDIIYCLDGKHRVTALEELVFEGVKVSNELPATFIDCKNKQEAAKLVLVYSSIYAKVQDSGLFDFIKEYELNLPELKEQINLPELNLDKFEQMMFGEESNFIAEPKQKPATIKITFQDPKQIEKAKVEIERILEEYEGAFLSVSCGEI